MVNGEIVAEEWKDEWGLGRVTWPNPTQASLVFSLLRNSSAVYYFATGNKRDFKIRDSYHWIKHRIFVSSPVRVFVNAYWG